MVTMIIGMEKWGDGTPDKGSAVNRVRNPIYFWY
jgi:hypothetical protein